MALNKYVVEFPDTPVDYSKPPTFWQRLFRTKYARKYIVNHNSKFKVGTWIAFKGHPDFIRQITDVYLSPVDPNFDMYILGHIQGNGPGGTFFPSIGRDLYMSIADKYATIATDKYFNDELKELFNGKDR